MALIDELKEMRASARDRMSEYLANADSYEELANIARDHIDDLDRAIAALEPQPPTTPHAMSDDERAELIERTEGDEAEQAASLTKPTEGSVGLSMPERFTPWEGGECLLSNDEHVEIWTRGCADWPVRNIPEVASHWNWKDRPHHPTDILGYRIITAPEHPLREASDDPARLVAEYYYGPDDGESEDIANVRERIIGDEAEQQASVDMAAAVERAKQAGAKAREAGEDSTACPYPQDSLEATAWTEAVSQPERKAGVLNDPYLDEIYPKPERAYWPFGGKLVGG